MSKFKVYPYKMFSGSAKKVAGSLQAKRVKLGGKFFPNFDRFVINWGNSNAPLKTTILNKPENVAVAQNKLLTLNKLRDAGIRVPEYTTDRTQTVSWKKIVARLLLRGHGGRGIVIRENDGRTLGEQVVAPLYVKWINVADEYRVHVMNGEVIDYSKKVLQADAQPGEIHNLEAGYLFARNVSRNDVVCSMAVNAVKTLGLDFGAVDVVRSTQGITYVLEVNTAPGLSPMGVEIYKQSFLRHYGNA